MTIHDDLHTCYVTIIVFLTIYIIYHIYATNNTDNINSIDNIDDINITSGDTTTINTTDINTTNINTTDINSINKQKKTNADYINKMQNGIFRGVLFGLLLDTSLTTAVRNGAIYAVINPLTMYFGMD